MSLQTERLAPWAAKATFPAVWQARVRDPGSYSEPSSRSFIELPASDNAAGSDLAYLDQP